MVEYMEDYANKLEGEDPENRIEHQFVNGSAHDLKYDANCEPGIYFIKDNTSQDHELIRVHRVVRKSLYSGEGYLFNATYTVETLKVFFLKYAEPKEWTVLVNLEDLCYDEESSSELEWETDI